MARRVEGWAGLLAFLVLIVPIEAPASRMIDVIDYSVLANPNNTISAVYSIEGSGISSARVEYQCTSCGPAWSLEEEWISTPEFPVTSGRFALPVLGLQPDSSYLMKAVLAGPAGGREETEPLVFHTGLIPPELDQAFIAWGPNPSPGHVIVSQNFSLSSASGFVVALDEEGKVSWYTHIPDTTLQSLVRVSELGTLLIFVTRAGSRAVYYEIDLFGNVVGEHGLPLLPGEEEDSVTLDNHEFLLLPGGDKIFLTTGNYTVDMTEYDGLPDATMVSHRVRRTTADETIIFDWGYLDAFDPTDSVEDLRDATIDWTHANSIDIDEDGHYVLSSRNFGEVTKINSIDGSVIWRMGGKNNQFTFVNDDLNGFDHQHAAIMLGEGRMLLFDNGEFHAPQESRAVEYLIDTEAMTATLVWEYSHNPIFYSRALCNAQRLACGNTLVNYGGPVGIHPRLVEATPESEGVWEIQIPFDFANGGVYRAFKIEDLYFGTDRVGAYVDGDGDGYYGFFDCDDQAPESYPGAVDPCDGVDQDCSGLDGIVEIPDNGIDDDCDGRIDETDVCFIGVGLDR